VHGDVKVLKYIALVCASNDQNPLHTFPRTNLLRTCCGLVSDTRNKSTTSWQHVVVMKFGKPHDTTNTTDRVNLLRTRYGKTSVMDFSLEHTVKLNTTQEGLQGAVSKSPNLLVRWNRRLPHQARVQLACTVSQELWRECL